MTWGFRSAFLGRGAGPTVQYAELDALRGIAILLVFATHASAEWIIHAGTPLNVPLLGVNALDLLRYGFLGVSLFFLLSGYLLTWTEESRARSGSYSVRSYALRRALRLVPALWVSILIVILVWPTHPSIADAVTQATFLSGINPYRLMTEDGMQTMDNITWSLTAEMFFYALLPFIVLKIPRLRQRLALFGLLVLASLAIRMYIDGNVVEVSQAQHSVLALMGTYTYLYSLPITHLYLFLAGVLLRMLVERLETRPRTVLRPIISSTLLLGSVTFLVVFPYAGMTISEVLLSPMAMVVDLAVIIFFTAALLGSPLLRGVLRWRPLIFVGGISYSFFLLHRTVLLVAYEYVLGGRMQALDQPAAWAVFAAVTLAALAVTVALSYLGYRFVENPFIRYKPK